MPKKDEPAEETLVIVGDGANPSPEETEEEASPSEAPEPEEKDDPEDRDPEPEDDERVGHSEERDAEETDEGREALRESRRQERKRRREREKRNQKELMFLRKRNEQVERQLSELAVRQTETEKVSIDQRIGSLESQIREAEDIHGAAIKAGDGTTATEALRVKDQLSRVRDKLAETKGKVEAQAPRRTEEPAPRREDPDVARNLRSWMDRNEWFDPKFRDETSHLVGIIEQRLANEGEYTADDPEYWRELDRRVAKRFPEMKIKGKKNAREEIFDEDDDEEDELTRREAPPLKKKGGGPRFSVGGRTRSLKPNEVFIDAERRAALEEMGVWEDKEARERYLNSYKRYDDEARQNKTR